MIPIFPKFKTLELHDKDEIKQFTHHLHPFSDFNFVSLWSWDTTNETQISTLNNNFVIRFPDYITHELFYSFIGTHNINQTITTLLDQAKKDKIIPRLQLIPHTVIKNIDSHKHSWHIKEDPDNHDYILDINQLAQFKGKKFHKKRNLLNSFMKNFGHNSKITHLNLANRKTQNQIKKVFVDWETSGLKNRDETQNEFNAINKLLTGAHKLNLDTIGLIYNDTLIAFAIEELIQKNYAISHYAKAIRTYPGIFEYLMNQSALHLQKKGAKHLNYEQDLGIPNLRKSKQSYRPKRYLKKFTISPKQNPK